MHASRCLFIGLTAWSLALAAPCHAKEWQEDGTTISFTGFAGIGAFTVANANFGIGSYDIRKVRDFSEGLRSDPGEAERSSFWLEAFLKPDLRLSHPLGANGTLFGEVSAVAATTQGSGDASIASITRGGPASISLEQAYIGYKIKPPFGLRGDSVAIQFGRQDFILDDGFLLHLARFNVGHSADFYLSPRGAFDGWGTLRFNTAPIRGDIFVLSTPVNNRDAYGGRRFVVDQPNTDFAGFDLEWFTPVDRQGANPAVNYFDRSRYLNFTYLYIFHSDRNPLLYGDDSPLYWARRDGLHLFSLAGGGNLIPLKMLGLDKNASLYFQYVRERNWTHGRKVDATGFYVEPGYQFANVAWTPTISYRYAFFSGNRVRPGEPLGVKRSYDPLFLGGGFRDYLNNYGPGEIIGTYFTPSSNLIVHSLELRLAPPFHLASKTDSLLFEILAYQFLFDDPRAADATSRRFAREIDISAKYSYDQNTTAALMIGAAFPQKGGRQWLDSEAASFPGAKPARGTSYIVEGYLARGF